jgi:hypothetical protein
MLPIYFIETWKNNCLDEFKAFAMVPSSVMLGDSSKVGSPKVKGGKRWRKLEALLSLSLNTETWRHFPVLMLIG